MENPASWTKIHHTINRAIQQHNKSLADDVIGGSLENAIYYALLKDGHIKEPDERLERIQEEIREQNEEGGY